MVMAHQGSDIEYQSYYDLSLHAEVIRDMTGKKVEFVPDVCGPYAVERIKAMKDGDIVLLDNVRFMAEEMTLFETKLNLTPEQMAQTHNRKKARAARRPVRLRRVRGGAPRSAHAGGLRAGAALRRWGGCSRRNTRSSATY